MVEVKGKRVMGRVLCSGHRMSKDGSSIATKLITLSDEAHGFISFRGKQAWVFRKHGVDPDYDWVLGFVRK